MAVRRAFLQTIIARQASLVVTAIAFVVLARLLTPEAYGLFAVAFALFTAGEILVGFGLKAWLVSEEALAEDAAPAALGLSLAIASGLGAAVMAGLVLLPTGLSPRDEGEAVAGMAVLLTGALLAYPGLLVFESLLERELRFGLLSVLAVLRASIDAGTAITLALLGFGPAALAAGVLAERLVGAVVLAIAAGRGGGLRVSARGWGRFVPLGSRLVFTNAVPQVTEVATALAVTAGLGTAAMGLFNRARTVDGMLDKALLSGIKPVVLPALSRALEAGHSPARLYLVKTTQLSVVCWPVFAVIAILAEPLVAVMLGDQWSDAVLPVRILALAGFVTPFTRMSGKFYVSLRRTGEYALIQTAHHVLLLVLVLPASTVSIAAVCAAFTGALAAKAALLSVRIKRLTGYETSALLRSAVRNAAVTLACAAGPALLMLLGQDLPSGALVPCGIALAASAWFASTFALAHPIAAEVSAVLGAVRTRLTPAGTPR